MVLVRQMAVNCSTHFTVRGRMLSCRVRGEFLKQGCRSTLQTAARERQWVAATGRQSSATYDGDVPFSSLLTVKNTLEMIIGFAISTIKMPNMAIDFQNKLFSRSDTARILNRNLIKFEKISLRSQALLLPIDSKSSIGFRLVYLHLTLSHFKGQGQSQFNSKKFHKLSYAVCRRMSASTCPCMLPFQWSMETDAFNAIVLHSIRYSIYK